MKPALQPYLEHNYCVAVADTAPESGSTRQTEDGREQQTAFYDGWVQRLLRDYASGNDRVEAAISFAVSALPSGPLRVLDIGCGVGWSTFEIARRDRNAFCVGIDLSPGLVAAARELFGTSERLQFETVDFTRGDLRHDRFDVIVLLDVYEHFPVAARADVHARFNDLLKENGRLILTTPTVEYQEFLRKNNPDGLQPVDEDVSPEDLQQLARDVGGRVALEKTVTIWQPRDYRHAVIDRGRTPAVRNGEARVERARVRAERVRSRLGIRWTRTVGFVSDRGSRNICVATPALPLTQTFVRQHLEHLPARIYTSGEALFPSLAARVVRKLARAVGKDPVGVEERLGTWIPREARAALYSRFFRRHKIGVVLAEFGTMAVEVHGGCRRAGIPVVAHFHGFDAFKTDTLDKHGDAYRELFAEGWPVVAVSESMKRQLVALGASPEQVHVIHYGVDIDTFRPVEPEPGLVVSVGRLVDKKAPELALLAFARAASRVPNARMVMIGDGPLRPSVERLIRGLKLEGRVQLEGARDHAWVAKTLEVASVFIQHSLVAADGDREGTPVAIVEAGAAAVPVVATRHEGIVDVVVDGETGILVDEGDAEAMGDALIELLTDPGRAREMGLAARRRIESSQSRNDAIRRLWDVLDGAAVQ